MGHHLGHVCRSGGDDLVRIRCGDLNALREFFMSYEDDIRDDESMTAALGWTISIAMFAVAITMIWFVGH